MKRWVVGAMAVLLAVSGCKAPPATTPITEGFSCYATVTYREMAVEGQLTCSDDGEMSLAFTLPKSLQGVALRWDGAAMTMELGGMSLELTEEKVPQSALIRCLLQVLTAPHPDGSETEDGYVVQGETEGAAYVLVCDPTSGLPRSLSVPEQELEAVFTETTRLTQPQS